MTERALDRPTRHAMRASRWLAMIAALAGAAVAQPARAEVAVSCDILEIEARQGDKPSIDGELKPVEKRLKKPPLSSWNQFKLLSHSQKSLIKKKPEPIALKHGSATATLIEIVDKSQTRVAITMADDKGKQVVNNTSTVEAGDYVVLVHDLGNQGHLLLMTCR